MHTYRFNIIVTTIPVIPRNSIAIYSFNNLIIHLFSDYLVICLFVCLFIYKIK